MSCPAAFCFLQELIIMWPTLCSLRVVTLLMPFSSAQLTGSRGQGDGCGHMLLGPGSGTLTSRNYPGTYPNHSWCEWQIQVPEGKKIFLKFGDLDLQQCISDYLKIFKGTSSSMTEYGTFCGNLNSISREIHIDSNEMSIQFKSGSHISGRGFLLSYTTSSHPDLITCLDKGNHYDEPQFSKNCPAGCKAVIGEVSGDFSQGYRHTSALCKAAIHAGVILDELGGMIDIVQHKGLSRYEGILANGVLSKDGSLSDKRIVFGTNGCNRPLGMELGHIAEHQINATSFWQWTDENGQVTSWSPGKARLNVPGPGWAAAEDSSQQWLEIDLGERKFLTGIITTGSTLPRFLFYVETYKVSFSEDGQKWKVYKESNNNFERIFEGNTDYCQLTRNNFIPAIFARYIRVIPQSWTQRIAMKVELIGCQQVQSITGVKQKSIHHIDILEKENVNNTDPIITKDVTCGIRLVAILVPIVLFVVLLILGIYIFKSLRNKKTEDSTGTYSQKTVCWKQFTQPFKRHQSTEFTISYSHEKEALQKLDVVRSDSSDYLPSPMVRTVRVARKGSTFKPIDTEVDDGTGQMDTLSHYVIPLIENQHEYAEPLTNQEPVYATPIVEKVQHLSYSTRKNLCAKETPYKVPVTSLTKTPLFSQVTSSDIEHNISNGNGLHPSSVFYQIPQGITDSSKNGKAEYDQPASNSTLIVGRFCGN
ncbi:discoidin, CUB and LCCL domain-containing protein 1 isoform X1 [Carcharodon carcharias]|uniref:discoidin, CUB and LCCL domain-containing protein 1 isoform X1 n=1 Tax=Carcharodon carcharias TaxID=13397 RepID=UPI001B7F4531|nr:discoidin, CUB and LCCL domain-containing protein 1 isoform X1 [Carcharodon carcharias]